MDLRAFARVRVMEFEKDAGLLNKVRGKLWSLGSTARKMTPEARKVVSGMAPKSRGSFLALPAKQQQRNISKLIKSNVRADSVARATAKDTGKLLKRRANLQGRLRQKGKIAPRGGPRSASQQAAYKTRRTKAIAAKREAIRADTAARLKRHTEKELSLRKVPYYSAAGGVGVGAMLGANTNGRSQS